MATEAESDPAGILLVAVNARHSHCSFAGRTLLANLGALQPRARLVESDLDATPLQLAELIVAAAPRVAAFPVYLWNKRLVRDTARLLRLLLPATAIALGGPEIVAGCAGDWHGLADALVCGEGEQAFRAWCGRQLALPSGFTPRAAPEWIAVEGGVPPEELALPYSLYSDNDLRQRTLYVESARGCPFHCLYCSSRGSGLRLLPLARLLPELERLLARGALRFKFLDRSFNAREKHACEVLRFFLAHARPGLQLHFEVVPVSLGDELRACLTAFAPGVLHLEVGVQTLSDGVARGMGRPEARATVLAVLRFLLQETGAHVHADLIFGLPGEDESSFAAGFDTLARLGVPQLQANRLKGLPGTPLSRLPDPRTSFNPQPPYEVLRTAALDFASLTRMQRLATVWERLHNRGHFRHAERLLWQAPAASPYAILGMFAAQVWAIEGRVHALGRDVWARHLRRFLTESMGVEAQVAIAALERDGVPPGVFAMGREER